MDPLPEKIRNECLAGQLIRPGDRVVLGISGGPDSTALLHIFVTLRPCWGLRLHAVHINHHLRAGAAQDQRFVEDLCRTAGVPLTVRHLHLGTAKENPSIEEKARRGRLDILTRTAKQLRADAVALAHTKNDLAETVLMRLARGTGLLGLQGIQPKRKLSGTVVIRPFLNTTKSELLDFLRSHKHRFRTDPSNASGIYTRNRVRNTVIPMLQRTVNPDVVAALANAGQTVALDYDFIVGKALEALRKISRRRGKRTVLTVAALKTMHPALRRMVLRMTIEEASQGVMPQIDLRHMAQMEDLILTRPEGTVVRLPGGWTVARSTRQLVLSRSGKT